MAVRIRVNPAQAEKLARMLPLPQPLLAVKRSVANGWVVGPCQRRQPPKAVAEGQRLRGPTTQPHSATVVDGWCSRGFHASATSDASGMRGADPRCRCDIAMNPRRLCGPGCRGRCASTARSAPHSPPGMPGAGSRGSWPSGPPTSRCSRPGDRCVGRLWYIGGQYGVRSFRIGIVDALWSEGQAPGGSEPRMSPCVLRVLRTAVWSTVLPGSAAPVGWSRPRTPWRLPARCNRTGAARLA